MKRIPLILALAATFVLARGAAAKDGGGFIVQLGNDTTSVENYVRDAARIEVDQVGRAPRVIQRHIVYELKDGVIQHGTVVATAAGSTTPLQTVDLTATADSLLVDVKSGDKTTPIHVAAPKGTLVVLGSSPWVSYELLTMRLAKQKTDKLETPMYLAGATSINHATVSRLGADSVSISNDHGDVYHARVDKAGLILGVAPISGTQKFGATRVATVDVPGYTANFAAREQSGAGLGVLSPRDSVKVATAGANLWIDYGRPGKRGRQVFGGIVPYGEVWRTGANAATQFRTDRDLDFGGTTVPAGFYTLWTIPTATGWKLVINSQTGQWGTEHDAKKDLYTIPMTVSAQPAVTERFTIVVQPNDTGGVITMTWDTTQASVPFTVKAKS